MTNFKAQFFALLAGLLVMVGLTVVAPILFGFFLRALYPESSTREGVEANLKNFVRGVLPRLELLVLGTALVCSGVSLPASRFAYQFLAGFLVVSGLQIMLWTIGVRLELLGNTAHDRDA